MKHKIAVALLILGLSSQVNPIHENTAKYGSIAGGAVVGATAGALMYFVGLGNSTMGPGGKIVISTLTALGTGGLTWYLLDQYLNTLTPTGKFHAANKMISLAEIDSLLARNFESEQEFHNHSTARFGTSWPLVLARKHLTNIRDNLTKALQLLKESYAEAQGKFEYSDLSHRCKDRERKATELKVILEYKLSYITQNNNYNTQITLYENHLEEQKKREAKTREKARERMHDSWERVSCIKIFFFNPSKFLPRYFFIFYKIFVVICFIFIKNYDT